MLTYLCKNSFKLSVFSKQCKLTIGFNVKLYKDNVPW